VFKIHDANGMLESPVENGVEEIRCDSQHAENAKKGHQNVPDSQGDFQVERFLVQHNLAPSENHGYVSQTEPNAKRPIILHQVC